VTRVEVVLVRNGRGGANHVAQPRPDRRGRYTLACWRTCVPGPRGLVQREPAEIRRSLSLEWICADCADLLRLAPDPQAFLRATGWRLAA
jgi:hypothetical protein